MNYTPKSVKLTLAYDEEALSRQNLTLENLLDQLKEVGVSIVDVKNIDPEKENCPIHVNFSKQDNTHFEALLIRPFIGQNEALDLAVQYLIAYGIDRDYLTLTGESVEILWVTETDDPKHYREAIEYEDTISYPMLVVELTPSV